MQLSLIGISIWTFLKKTDDGKTLSLIFCLESFLIRARLISHFILYKTVHKHNYLRKVLLLLLCSLGK